MSPDRRQFAFKHLCEAVERRKLEAVIAHLRIGKADRLRIEIRSGNRIIDVENVMPKESVDQAATRLHRKIGPMLGSRHGP